MWTVSAQLNVKFELKGKVNEIIKPTSFLKNFSWIEAAISPEINWLRFEGNYRHRYHPLDSKVLLPNRNYSKKQVVCLSVLCVSV